MSGREAGPFRRRGDRGYTVLEIVAVLGVFLVALAIGFYSMGDWRGRNKFGGVVTGFKQAITLTRARAIARQKPVILQVVKPIPRSTWKHSENYFIQERTAGDGKQPTDTNPSADKEYWLEFMSVAEKTTGGLDDYEIFINGSVVDSGLNYADSDANRRGQICFSARGYNITPVSGGTPMTSQADLRSNSLKRTVRMTVSPLGDVTTQAVDTP